MDALVQFSIPVSGLRDGTHSFDFQIDNAFFECFEASRIKDGSVNAKLLFDKRPSLFVMDFEISGFVNTPCDRCLEEMNLPIEIRQSLMVKFDEMEREEAEVIYVFKGTQKINVAKYIYEFIHLAIPIHKTHDEAGESCNEEMLKYLDSSNFEDRSSEENPVWAALKEFNKDK